MNTNSKVVGGSDSRVVMDLATEILSAMIIGNRSSVVSNSMISTAIATAKEIVKQSKSNGGFRTKDIP